MKNKNFVFLFGIVLAIFIIPLAAYMAAKNNDDDHCNKIFFQTPNKPPCVEENDQISFVNPMTARVFRIDDLLELLEDPEFELRVMDLIIIPMDYDQRLLQVEPVFDTFELNVLFDVGDLISILIVSETIADYGCNDECVHSHGISDIEAYEAWVWANEAFEALLASQHTIGFGAIDDSIFKSSGNINLACDNKCNDVTNPVDEAMYEEWMRNNKAFEALLASKPSL
jgi:hypothetical protein